MTNHPNRSRRKDAPHAPGEQPIPAQVAQLREEMELTQREFGARLYMSERTVQDWESGRRNMPRAMWEYICLQHGFRAVDRARLAWISGNLGRASSS